MARLRWSFALPVAAAGAAGGFIGWAVARVGCLDGSCGAYSVLAAGLIAGLAAAGGVGIVVVLADRSLREWREWQAGLKEGREPGGGSSNGGSEQGSEQR